MNNPRFPVFRQTVDTHTTMKENNKRKDKNATQRITVKTEEKKTIINDYTLFMERQINDNTKETRWKTNEERHQKKKRESNTL